MASFDPYRNPAELRKLYLHCQYMTRGSAALRVRKQHSARVVAAFLRASIDIPANANSRRKLSQSVARLAFSIWQGIDAAQDTIVLFVDCLLGTANYQLPPNDRDQAVAELRQALDAADLVRVTRALRFWR